MSFRGPGPGVVIASSPVMRILAGVVALACMSCTRPSPPPNPGPPVRVACRTSLAEYCAANRCDRTLADSEQDSSLCPATITACSDTTVVSQSRGDAATLSYYQGGQLVAIVTQLSPGQRYVCVAGPELFVLPGCALSSQHLPACGS